MTLQFLLFTHDFPKLEPNPVDWTYIKKTLFRDFGTLSYGLDLPFIGNEGETSFKP